MYIFFRLIVLKVLCVWKWSNEVHEKLFLLALTCTLRYLESIDNAWLSDIVFVIGMKLQFKQDMHLILSLSIGDFLFNYQKKIEFSSFSKHEAEQDII